MTLTAQTLARHELAGLDVSVVTSTNPDLVGLSGTVVEETEQTLGIETDRGTKQVPKAAATFEWTLPEGQRVRTDGEALVAGPARRSEHRSDSIWR